MSRLTDLIVYLCGIVALILGAARVSRRKYHRPDYRIGVDVARGSDKAVYCVVEKEDGQ